MSQDNVEIAKLAIDAYNRGDADSFAALATADFEWFPALPGAVEGADYVGYQGREAIATFFRDRHNTWEEVRIVAEEFRDLGDRGLMLGRLEGRGRSSGVPIDAPIGIVTDFRDGKFSRMRGYLDHAEALRAAGLSE